MAFRDKLTEVAKNVAEKTSTVAKNVADKGAEKLEIRALNSKIRAEQDNIAILKIKLAEYYWAKYADGGELYEEAADLCKGIKESEDNIAAFQAEIKAKKEVAVTSEETAASAQGALCSHCGSINPENAKFCNNCGTQFENQPANADCICGTAIVPKSKFCNECGQRVRG